MPTRATYTGGTVYGVDGTRYTPPQPKKRHGPPKPQDGPWTPQQTLSFVGSLTNGNESASFDFNVLAGTGAPTITGGWAKINTIDRPRSLGFTLPAGFDPITMDVPVQFEAVVKYKNPADVEGDIQKLEWMAGRGKLFATRADHGVGRAASGDPPIVTVASYDRHQNETDLIPRSVHGINWLISGISYDPNPIRDESMRRVRQNATVALVEFVSAPDSTNDSPSTRARGRNSSTGSFETVHATSAWDTVQALVTHHTNKTSSAAFRQVLAFNRSHGIQIRSATQKLRLGNHPQRVLIPSNLAD